MNPRKPHSSAVNSEEGWLLWPQAEATEAGELTLDLTTIGAGTLQSAHRRERPAPGNPSRHRPRPKIPSTTGSASSASCHRTNALRSTPPAGDALPNLLKYALDLDPTLPATGTDRRSWICSKKMAHA